MVGWGGVGWAGVVYSPKMSQKLGAEGEHGYSEDTGITGFK